MPGLCKYIVTVLLFLAGTFNVYCQEISDDPNTHETHKTHETHETHKTHENLINNYELVCGQCMEMKQKVKSGSKISRLEAEKRLNRFIALNKEIKSLQNVLSENLNSRFIRINQWFATGIRPAALNDKLETPEIDNNLEKYGHLAMREPIIFCPKPHYNYGDSINEAERRRLKKKLFILANVSVPVSYGLRVGFLFGRWGGYISGRSNFGKNDHSYTCKSDRTMENNLVFWGTGRARRSNMSVCAGVVFEAVKWLDIYAGAGYGFRKMYFEDIEKKWAIVSDLSHTGVSAEAGVVLTWKRLALSAGISTVQFRNVSADFGIGISF